MYVCQGWWRRGGEHGGGGGGGEMGIGGAARTSSLPDSDAIRAATMAVLLWRAYNTPSADREMGRGEGRTRK